MRNVKKYSEHCFIVQQILSYCETDIVERPTKGLKLIFESYLQFRRLVVFTIQKFMILQILVTKLKIR